MLALYASHHLLAIFYFSSSLHTWFSVSEQHLKIVHLSSFINMSQGAIARTKQAVCMVPWKL